MIIGDKYYLDDYETGIPYRVSKSTYEAHQKMIADFHERISKMIKPDGERKGVILISSTPADPDCDNSKRSYDLWMDCADKYNNPNCNYFQPAYTDSNFDQYGHAILPTGLREITDDAISTARLQFPKTEDEAFGDTPIKT